MKDKNLKHTHSADTPDMSDALRSELEKKDPLWDLLGKASTQEPSDFFARNVLREARSTTQVSEKRLPLSRIFAFLSPSSSPRKLAVSAIAACTCALIAFQMWPSSGTNDSLMVNTQTEVTPTDVIEVSDSQTALASFIMEETLIAAAEDPTIFSHDEVLAMIGF